MWQDYRHANSVILAEKETDKESQHSTVLTETEFLGMTVESAGEY